MLRAFCLILLVLAAPLRAEMAVPQSRPEVSAGFVSIVRRAAPAVRPALEVQRGTRRSVLRFRL